MGHVGKEPTGSTHMNIQLKFLCIAAYEGFVHNTKIGYIEHYIKQVLLLVFHAGCKC